MDLKRIKTGPRMSQAVVHGSTVYLSGQIALDGRDKPIAEQTRMVLQQIDALLEDAGTDKSQIVSATIWLTDMANFGQMNEVWDAWVSPGAAPARATVGAALALSGLFVEIGVVAALS